MRSPLTTLIISDLDQTVSVNVFWFRRDLRLEDNHGLYHALKGKLPVLPVFIFDPEILENLQNRADKRVSFIHQILGNIQSELLRSGSSLYVIHDKPLSAFRQITDRFKVECVFTNNDYEPYGIARDEKIKEYLDQKGIGFRSFKDHVIFERAEVVKADGKPYTVFTPYSRAWKFKLQTHPPDSFNTADFTNKFLRTDPFPLPKLEEMGFTRSMPEVSSKEVDNEKLANYDKTKDIPHLNGTSRLGMHLRFGTISIRKTVRSALLLNDNWLNELIWREFFISILYHFPAVVAGNFKRKFDRFPWINDEKAFEKWCTGNTGYHIVDAGMRELNQTGFMHNRVRMITASFLTKHLLIDWRWGEAYFADKLLDYELASNNGNWQWVAGSGCDAAPYFRIFNPWLQAKRFDPDNRYIRKWLKEDEINAVPIVNHAFARDRALNAYKQLK